VFFKAYGLLPVLFAVTASDNTGENLYTFAFPHIERISRLLLSGTSKVSELSNAFFHRFGRKQFSFKSLTELLKYG